MQSDSPASRRLINNICDYKLQPIPTRPYPDRPLSYPAPAGGQSVRLANSSNLG